MISLLQLLAAHRSLLVLDAASARVQVGLIREDGTSHWAVDAGEAGRALFHGTQSVLRAANLELAEVGACAFCEGPGSMLGIRTAAMVLRTWGALLPRPVFAYQSLALAALAEYRREPRPFTVVADARRDSWHVQTVATNGELGRLQRVTTADLPPGELTTPENFRAWSQPPRPAGGCRYDLASIFRNESAHDLFRPTEFPDAFQHEAPDYKKSPAKIHSVETAVRK